MPYLTKDLILDLQPALKPYKVSDEVSATKTKNQGVPGLLIRVCAGGAKTFAVQYRTKEGRKGWYPIGRFGVLTLDQARDEARKILLQVAQGQDPSAKLRVDRDAMTVSELVEKFITDHASTKADRTRVEYARLMRSFLVPRLGSRKVKSVGSGDIADLLTSIKRETPTQANRVLAVARKMFNLAELWELRDRGSNPMIGHALSEENARERRMVEAEVRALGEILQEVSELQAPAEVEGATLQPETHHFIAAIKLYLLAGFRKEELLCLRWAWVDLDKGVVVIPPEFHKTGRKTKKPRLVYLCPEAVALLRALPRFDEDEDAEGYNPYIIAGRYKGTPLVQLWDPWRRVRKAVTDRAKHEAKKHKKKTAPAVNIEDVTIHDLRRTFASVAADLGHPELIIKAMLGHQSLGSVTEVYTRLSIDPIRNAVNEVGGTIAGWLGLPASEPTP